LINVPPCLPPFPLIERDQLANFLRRNMRSSLCPPSPSFSLSAAKKWVWRSHSFFFPKVNPALPSLLAPHKIQEPETNIPPQFGFTTQVLSPSPPFLPDPSRSTAVYSFPFFFPLPLGQTIVLFLFSHYCYVWQVTKWRLPFFSFVFFLDYVVAPE